MNARGALGDVDLAEMELAALGAVFARLGWQTEVRGASDIRTLSLLAGGAPQVCVTLTQSAAVASSLAYSNEAALTCQWSNSQVRVARTQIWRESPGDSAVGAASTDDEVAVTQLLSALSPDTLPGLLDAPQSGEAHPELATSLAAAFARLRGRVAEGLDARVGERDVFQLFHQLLFVRFHEDRFGALEDAGSVRDLLAAGEDAPTVLQRLLSTYGDQFNSELFGAPIPVQFMPRHPLVEVARSLVEPWEKLRLNFSVAHNDVAGRLYQSFLANTPAVQLEGRLFPVATTVDRQKSRGAFYTPQSLALDVARRCLTEVLARRRPKSPAEIHVLDLACGSGAFLLAAFETLREYFADLRGRALSEAERIEILAESLLGGDEDETAAALTRIQLLEAAEIDRTRLPKLSERIAPYDALSGADTAMPAGWLETLRNGGFDAILSNPPFNSPRGAQRSGVDTASLSKRFVAAHGTGWNFASLFVEAALPLLAPHGQLSMVLPQSLLDGPAADALRSDVVGSDRVARVVDLGRGAWFGPAMAYVAVVTIDAVPNGRHVALETRDGGLAESADEGGRIESATHDDLENRRTWSPFVISVGRAVQDEVGKTTIPFDSEGAPSVVIGTQTGRDSSFVLGPDRWVEIDEDHVLIDGTYEIPTAHAPFWVRGGDLRPFARPAATHRVVVPALGANKNVDAFVEAMGGTPPSYRPGDLARLRAPKVVARGLFDEPAAVADTTGEWLIPQGGAGAVALVPARASDLRLLEALLNSAFYQWILQGVAHPKDNGFAQLMRHHWAHLPWPLLARSERSPILQAAAAVRKTLTATSTDRVARYWDARVRLDETVLEVLLVTEPLRDRVLAELRRRP